MRCPPRQEGRAAARAEGAELPGRGLVLREEVPARDQPEVLGAHGRVGREGRAARPAALRAVAVARRADLAVDLVAHPAAEAASGEHGVPLLVPELLDQPAEVQLDLARLPAQGEEALHPLLRRPGRERLVEAVRLLDEPFDGRQLGGVDGRLRERDRLGREGRDPAREALDEGAELGGGQRAVQVAVALRHLGGKILAAEADLERAAPSPEAREPLRGAAAGDDPQRHLWLCQDGAPERAEAHVEREEELAPSAARAALDLADGRLRHGAEAVHHGVEEAEAGGLRRRRGGGGGGEGAGGGGGGRNRSWGLGGEEAGPGAP